MRGVFVDTKADMAHYEVFKREFMTKELIKEHESLYIKNTGFDAACRLVRFLAKDYLQFNEHLDSAMRNIKYKASVGQVLLNTPFMYIDKSDINNIRIRVFPNLFISTNDYDILKQITPFVYMDRLIKTAELLKANSAHLTDFRRAWAKIKKSELLSPERAIARYTKIGTDGTAARDIAAYLQDMFKPLELEYATDRAGIITMYSENAPHSCMILNKNEISQLTDEHRPVHGGFNPKHSAVYKFWGAHPCELYLHFGAKGVYAKKGKTVIARTFLFPPGVNSKMTAGTYKYGRIYSSSPVYRTQFIEMLEKAGYTAIDKFAEKGGTIDQSYEFSVPYLNPNDDRNKIVVPFPYIDNLSTNIYMFDDKDNNQIKFRIGSYTAASVKEWSPCSAQLQRGYAFAAECTMHICSHCSNKMKTAKYAATDGKSFCSGICLSSAGYTVAYRADGLQLVVEKNAAVEDVLYPGSWFTNPHACIAHGGAVYFNRDTIEEYLQKPYPKHLEGMRVTRKGYKVLFKNNTDKRFAFDKDIFDMFMKLRIVYVNSPMGAYIFDPDLYSAWRHPVKTEPEKPKKQTTKKIGNITIEFDDAAPDIDVEF